MPVPAMAIVGTRFLRFVPMGTVTATVLVAGSITPVSAVEPLLEAVI
jgi:hypothetical protein